ncbi:hypothetical protein [Streptomyces mirabilis]|nr:hypothetical protein [Streptomyces mirabilis]MCX4609677.1 hypothetical protein [Streptomyces mirabilis]
MRDSVAASIRIHQHALDLDQPPAALLAQVDDIAAGLGALERAG